MAKWVNRGERNGPGELRELWRCGWEYHELSPISSIFNHSSKNGLYIYIYTYYLYTVEMKPIPVMVYCCGSHIWVCQTNVGEPVIYVN